MKKQIFILTMLTLAFLFAGVKSYGQYKGKDNPYLDEEPDCVPAVSLDCSTDDSPLNPIPGKEYDYTIDVQPEVGSNEGAPGYIRWFVYNATSNGSLIEDGVLIDADNVAEVPGTSQFLLSATTDVYNSVSNPSNSITIQWQSFDGLTNHILLVAYVLGEDGCADNIEAYRIEPAFSFTLDVASLMPNGELVNGGADPAEECVSPVWSAEYDQVNPNGTLAFDYGANYVFFSVNAANFVHSWQPKLEAVHDGGSLISEIAWAYPTDAIANTAWNTADNDGVFPVVKPTDNAEAVGANGECIVVRVLVEHGDVENADPSTVTLTVNGIMYDASVTTGDAYATADLADLDDVDIEGDTVCQHVDDADQADYILIPRPKIESDTWTTPPGDDPLPFVPEP